MFKKIILIFSCLGLLYGCGFTPIHSIKSNNNFSIEKLAFVGDKTINNYLKVSLKQFQDNSSENKFGIEVNTKYEKNTLAKDKTAKITNFKLSSSTIIQISLEDVIIKEMKIYQDKDMDSNDDKFEEQKIEKNIKQNFASSITRQLITELSILNDN